MNQVGMGHVGRRRERTAKERFCRTRTKKKVTDSPTKLLNRALKNQQCQGFHGTLRLLWMFEIGVLGRLLHELHKLRICTMHVP